MLTLLRRNAAFIYFSFVVTGLTTIAPQRLFAKTSAESAPAWVAVTLLVGTLASIAGVALADRYGISRLPAFTASALIVAMTVALLASFGAKVFWVAAALQVATRFIANYVKQDMDHRAVTVAGSEGRVANDRVAVMMRFVGMLLGPLWFGTFQLTSSAMLVTIFAMTIMSLASAADLTAVRMRSVPTRHRRSPLRFSERLFFAVGIGIYATYYLLASNIIYMLGRFHEPSRASVMAGVLITTVYGMAMLTTMVSLKWKFRHLGLMALVPAGVLMAVVGPALISPLGSVTAVDVAGAVALGLAFAFYLMAVRNQVTLKTRVEDSRWLAFFNNLANSSALVAFSIMAVLVVGARVLDIDYGVLLAFGLSALALVTLVGTIVLQIGARRSANPKG